MLIENMQEEKNSVKSIFRRRGKNSRLRAMAGQKKKPSCRSKVAEADFPSGMEERERNYHNR